MIGFEARDVSEDGAWEHVAGLTVGQDLSERERQLFGQAAQYSLGKSFPGYGPIGPWLVTVDELADRDDLAIGCAIDGEVMQASRTSDLICSVPQLIVKLSSVVTLLPGDLIFTGTPSGVGRARSPQRFLRPGEQLVSTIEGIGSLTTRVIACE